MEIKAHIVKELRERTGAGIMDCKKALQQTDGDIEAAIAYMRKSGAVKAAKKAGRIAAEGRIVIEQSHEASTMVVLLEINSETDFVAKDENFVNFCGTVAACLLEHEPAEVEALMELDAGGQNLEELRSQLVAKIGEHIHVRRFAMMRADGHVGTYLHGHRIGVLVDLTGADAILAKDLAMHIAASKPTWISQNDIPKEVLEEERKILLARAQASGKPEEIINKMVDGQIKKFVNETTLLGQPYVKDPDKMVGTLLKEKQATVAKFLRYELGEGLERRTNNFAAEVMAQAAGS